MNILYFSYNNDFFYNLKEYYILLMGPLILLTISPFVSNYKIILQKVFHYLKYDYYMQNFLRIFLRIIVPS
jgi:hypothetical protein